jgi:aminoglycoside phosphotransferase (APT) family kinase protein
VSEREHERAGDAAGVGPLRREALEAYLSRRGQPGAKVVALTPLAPSGPSNKALGYGTPVRVTFEHRGRRAELVVRTARADGFGHDRRADRVAALVLDFDCFGLLPRHVPALDVGVLQDDGTLASLVGQEPYLVTPYVEGQLYADELVGLERLDDAPAAAVSRARALALYLAALHRTRAAPEAYRRSIRDVLGSGEGIFGIAESFPAEHPVVTRRRLVALEQAAVPWRWRLRERVDRARRIHGDFHPYNLLFREGDDFTALDASRGVAGDPADDLTCLAINYLFASLRARGRLGGAFEALWTTLWSTYLSETGDRGLLEGVAPFFAWRALVLASPAWYPDVEDALRDRLLTFAERLLAGAPFDPARVEALLA